MSRAKNVRFNVEATPQQVAGLDPIAHLIRHSIPFFLWPIVAILGVLMNLFWHDSYYVLIFTVVAAIVISGLVFVLPPYGFNSTFIHGAVTSVSTGALLFLIDLFGWTSFNIFMMIAAVPLICLTWSIRIAIEGNEHRGLNHIFHRAGIPGAKMTIHDKVSA
jgi:hypothetical protein